MFRFLLVALALGAAGRSFPAPDTVAAADRIGTLTIRFHGLKSDEGVLMVALSNSEADFGSKRKAYRSAKVEIGGHCMATFAPLHSSTEASHD